MIHSGDLASNKSEAHKGIEESWRKTVKDAGRYLITGAY